MLQGLINAHRDQLAGENADVILPALLTARFFNRWCSTARIAGGSLVS
jgi:hypothetical protein